MKGIKAIITKYISDEPQPGIVECKFNDAWNNDYYVHEKTAVVTADYLDWDSTYPAGGFIACEIISEWTDAQDRSILSITTNKPWYIETIEGQTEFEILKEQLVEIVWQ
jgi:hypothetical protein